MQNSLRLITGKGSGECRCLPNNQKDMRGLRVGLLTVIEHTAEKNSGGSILWKCVCDCGKVALVSQDALHSHKTRSCGCLKIRWQQRIPTQLHMVDDTCVEWLKSRKNRSDNTSGFRGVSHRKNGKYAAYIGFKRERYGLGLYDTFEEARQARMGAEAQLHEAFVAGYNAWAAMAKIDPVWGEMHPFKVRVNRKDKNLFELELL